MLLFLLAAAAGAAPLAADGAFRAAEAWRRGGVRHMGRTAGAPTGRMRTISEDGTELFHLVELEGGGFIVVSADDSRPPVMAFSPTGELPEEDDGSPFWAMLAADGAVARGLPPRKSARRRLFAHESHASRVAAGTGTAKRATAVSGVSSVSDVRVAPLVESKWNQMKVGSKNVYNYYTPNHWYCGCVATAMAQLMRFHQYPTASIAAKTFTCYSNDVSVSLTMKGGPYDWNSMPLVPTSSITDTQREAIGRLCYDAGVAVRMRYTSGGSGAFTAFVHNPIKSVFGYANAQSYCINGSFSATEIAKTILANLDAGYPVLLGIEAPGSDGQDAGHAILADGYGYEAGTLWCHLNLGWSGSYDLWYALPDIPAGGYAFSIVNTVVYNVFPSDTGELVTGRVTDPDGHPMAGATVRASYTSRNIRVTTNVMTSATGIYAFRLPMLSSGSRTITLDATYGAASSGSATTSIRSSSSPSNLKWETGNYSSGFSGLVIGNSWGNDLVVTPADGTQPTVASFAAATRGGADGFSLSFAGTGGAKYDVLFSETLTNRNWSVVTNLLLGPEGSATLFLPIGNDDAGFWRVVPHTD